MSVLALPEIVSPMALNVRVEFIFGVYGLAYTANELVVPVKVPVLVLPETVPWFEAVIPPT